MNIEEQFNMLRIIWASALASLIWDRGVGGTWFAGASRQQPSCW